MTFAEITQSPTPILVDFFATWCGPCKAMNPVLKELKDELGERVRIFKIDVDKHTDLAVEQKVMGVPMFVVFKNGQEQFRQAGALTKETLKQAILKAENA